MRFFGSSIISLVCLHTLVASAFAQAVPPPRVPTYKLFQRYTEGILAPDAKDLRVGSEITGYAGLWRGRPWFEPLLWCSQMSNAQNQRDFDSNNPALRKQAEDLYLDAFERYEADRGTNFHQLTGKNPVNLLLLSFRLSGYKRDTGQMPDAGVCVALHRDYMNATSVIKPSASMSSSAAAIPYAGPGGPLKVDPKDLRITIAGGAAARWKGRAWHEPLLWCSALNLVEYQQRPNDELKQAITTEMTLAATRVAKDRGVSIDEFGGAVREQASFIGRQMQADNFAAKPEFATARSECRSIVSTYQAESAAK